MRRLDPFPLRYRYRTLAGIDAPGIREKGVWLWVDSALLDRASIRTPQGPQSFYDYINGIANRHKETPRETD